MGSPRVDMTSVFERMGEAQGLAESGRLAEAEMMLHGMKREPGCPEVVRTTLAAWMSRRGEYAAAESLLTEAAGIGVNQKLMAAVRTLRGGQDGDEALGWLERADPVEGDALPEADEAGIDRLRAELMADPGVLESVVAGLGLMGDGEGSGQARLLRAGLEQAAEDLIRAGHGLMVCRAMARLCELLGDHAGANAWARRGLAEQPTDEKLGLLLSRQPDEVEGVDPGGGESTAVVLARISDAHPDYPDVRAALIRRLMKDGEAGEAMRRLEAWRTEEPGCGVAEALEKEVAA
ncbi:MAG: hypothetical protein AAGI68_03230 [Planctomycetota bacterium]